MQQQCFHVAAAGTSASDSKHLIGCLRLKVSPLAGRLCVWGGGVAHPNPKPSTAPAPPSPTICCMLCLSACRTSPAAGVAGPWPAAWAKPRQGAAAAGGGSVTPREYSCLRQTACSGRASPARCWCCGRWVGSLPGTDVGLWCQPPRRASCIGTKGVQQQCAIGRLTWLAEQ